jgi:hypothetical protein
MLLVIVNPITTGWIGKAVVQIIGISVVESFGQPW